MTVDRRDGLALDIQFNHGWVDFPELAELAVLAERAGFDTLWIADHLSGVSMNAPTMPECFATLGGLAAVTSTIGLGSLVANSRLRHPVLLANTASTLQQMSEGRFTLGIGAGASPRSTFAAELVAAGLSIPVTLAERHTDLVNQVESIKRVWSSDRDERFAGFPLPLPRPRIVFGVNSPELAQLAVSHADGINVRASHPQVDEILAIAEGRIESSVWVTFDPGLLDANDERIAGWFAKGVRRVVAVMTGKPDKSLIERLI